MIAALYFLLLLLLHLLIGSCPHVFYAVCLFSCDVDVQLSQQRFEGRSGGLGVFGFPFLAIFAGYYPVFMVSPCSSSDSGPACIFIFHQLFSLFFIYYF
jgi:hypothetical protein